MTDVQSYEDLQDQIQLVIAAKTDNFLELARIAGLNPMVDLAGADLSQTNLSRADLRGADLVRSDLSYANLRGANLTGANLAGANLTGASLTGVTLPQSNFDGVLYRANGATAYALNLFLVPVAAGFPAPAEDYIEDELDLNQYLIRHPAATFFVRVCGDSMIRAGIHPDDLLVVDRALEPVDGNVVIAVVNGELTVKRLSRTGEHLLLLAENDSYLPLEINEYTEFRIWGVVTSVIHSLY